jgi:putative hydrolase of the HAD superfamily
VAGGRPGPGGRRRALRGGGDLRQAGGRKPEPGIFLAALEQAGAPAEATVHVGDQPVNDVEAATAVGITPVLLDRYDRVPDAGGHRVGSMAELVALLDGEA